jgi:hypothetical protein
VNFKILITIIFVGITLFITFFGFDSNIFKVSLDEKRQINTQHNFYTKELGSLYTNKVSQKYINDLNPVFDKYFNNLFNHLSPNLYFFQSHPRERGYVGEVILIPWVFVILFIYGLIIFLKNPNKIFLPFFFIIFFLMGFISQGYKYSFVPGLLVIFSVSIFGVHDLYKRLWAKK